MVCETRVKPAQTPAQRAEEVRQAVARLSAALATGRVKALVSKQGGIAFQGFTDAERDGLSDSCAYRKLMTSGSPTTKAALAKAEALAGRAVDKQLVASGWHMHADGKWHPGHK